MKKLGALGLAVLFVFIFTMPAAALENQFGGYWRTRAYTMQDFTGDESEGNDWSGVDTRTRLYYTAVLNENLKFVNKFEMDAVWGDDGYGDIGADGIKVEVKNSYADFNISAMNFKLGVQGLTVARGLMFDDDFAGAVIAYSGEGIVIPLVWIKAYEGGTGNNEEDFDYYGIAPVITAGKATINPFVLYAHSGGAYAWSQIYNYNPNGIDVEAPFTTLNIEDGRIYYAGLNLDFNLDPISLWFAGIYEAGTLDPATGDGFDLSAWLAAGGISIGTKFGNIHGQAFYATGQDPEDVADNDLTAFYVPAGQSYYWAEIMGYGIFDADFSNNSPGDQISNIMVANAGFTLTPKENMSVILDVWYAALAEDIKIGQDEENELGIEADLTLSYQLIEGLNVDLVAAYLFAGDATTMKVDNKANPWEVGTQFSLSF